MGAYKYLNELWQKKQTDVRDREGGVAGCILMEVSELQWTTELDAFTGLVS